jgi:hypothetical protein
MADTDPEPRPAVARVRKGVADAETLVGLGVLEPQRKPPPDGPREPPAEEQAKRAALDAALAEAGVTKGAADTEALDALATLDAATVEVIASWVKHKKKDAPPVKA